MLILVLMLVMAFMAPHVRGVYESDRTRSSYYTTIEGQVLLGHVTTTTNVQGLVSCAQRCLSRQRCLSFNFKKDSSLCELNNCSAKFSSASCDFLSEHGAIHGYWVTITSVQFVFTTLGAKGSVGPTSTSGYLGSSLEGKVKLSKGIQIWTVPNDGEYFIDAMGASGANGTCVRKNCSGWKLGGLGARIAGQFKLVRGQKIKILVGQEGQISKDFLDRPGGGGGGTFVTLLNNLPLIVAGGGGGGGISQPGYLDGDPGQVTPEGSRHGGKAGAGGKRFHQIKHTDPTDILSGTGGGLLGDGKGGAISFVNGGIGGDTGSEGGFGGGGNGLLQPGGGGGYSGGGVIGTISSGAAGGGGSINNGTSQNNESGVNKGDGRVIVTLIN